jgi:hypothetical protein
MLVLGARVAATETRDSIERKPAVVCRSRCNFPSTIEALHRDDRIGPAECEGIANPHFSHWLAAPRL